VNEAIDRLIAERERLDAGLSAPLLASLAAHFTIVGLAFVVPLLLPSEPPLRVADGFAVVLPRGGAGSPTTPPPVTAPAAAPEPAPPPKVVKPPQAEPKPQALPLPDSHRAPRPKKTAEPPTTLPAARTAPGAATKTAAGVVTPGLEFGPSGPGVPGGTDSGGDWYLAGVQQKIWTVWNQQIKSGFTRQIGVTFTILPDGSVTELRVTEPSGASLLDMAAQRAILNAAPFGPLPREYGQNPRTIQAVFKPTD
jgi:periplasmic protein TonB